MKILYTAFGKTKLVRATPHNMKETDTPDEILWIERAEDEYALITATLKAKKIAVVYREDWLRAKEIKMEGQKQ